MGYAQSPQAFAYQAVARNMDGFPLEDTDVLVKVGIHANSMDGVLMWEEEHVTATDGFGLFTLSIGEGSSTGNGNSPTFALINWGIASYFLTIEMDAGEGYELLGGTQLLSVPYALYSEKAGNIDEAIITSFTYENDSLIITEAATNHVLDIGPMLEQVLAGESINLVQLVGNELNIVEGDDAFVIDLSSLQDDGDWEQSDDAVFQTQRPVGVGTTNPSSSLDVKGSIAMAVTQFQGPVNATLDETHHVILANVSNGDITFTLPDAATCVGRIYTIKRFGTTPLSSIVNILPVNGAEIETEVSYVLSGFNGQVLELISDGVNWWILSYETIN